LSDGTQCPSSGRMLDAAHEEDSSEETNNSYLEMDDDPSRFESFKSYRHHYERYHKETTGRLRRFGLIFHHHHHHDHGNTHSREGHGPTT